MGSQNQVSFRIGEDLPSHSELFDMLRENRRVLRAEASWLGAGYDMSGMDEVFGSTPATEIAYQWLWRDLQRISWVKGMFNRRSP